MRRDARHRNSNYVTVPPTPQERAVQNLKREVRRCDGFLRKLTGAEAQRLRGDLSRAERALLNGDHAEVTYMVAVLGGYGQETKT